MITFFLYSHHFYIFSSLLLWFLYLNLYFFIYFSCLINYLINGCSNNDFTIISTIERICSRNLSGDKNKNSDFKKKWMLSCFPPRLIHGCLINKKTNKGTLVEKQESMIYDLLWFVIAHISLLYTNNQLHLSYMWNISFSLMQHIE